VVNGPLVIVVVVAAAADAAAGLGQQQGRYRDPRCPKSPSRAAGVLSGLSSPAME
jgi:hypothetical protein